MILKFSHTLLIHLEFMDFSHQHFVTDPSSFCVLELKTQTLHLFNRDSLGTSNTTICNNNNKNPHLFEKKAHTV